MIEAHREEMTTILGNWDVNCCRVPVGYYEKRWVRYAHVVIRLDR